MKSQVKFNPVKSQRLTASLAIVLWYCTLVKANGDWFITRLILGRFQAMKRDKLINDKDYETLVTRATHEGYQFLTVTLPSLGKAFDKALGDELLQLPGNFGSYKGSGIPRFLVQHFRRVFRMDGTLLDNPSVESIRAIRQVCFYAYKAKLPVGKAKEDRVVSDFLATEREVLAFVGSSESPFLPDRLSPIVDKAAEILGRVFHDFSIGRVLPRHGKGVTADLPVKRKWASKPKSAGHSWNDPLVSCFGGLFYFSSEHECSLSISQPGYDPYLGWLRPDSSMTARVLLVPKDSRGPRLISAEPVHRQFIQQGIMSYMVDTLQRHALTQGNVNFDNQEVNRALALEGSKSREWSTLDLKEASDRVSLAMVQAYFQKCPELLRCLIASRSSHTRLPNGSVVELAKFAPMGSACCFPVLAACVWATVAAAVELLSLPCDPKQIFVYGDDVIVPTKIANLVGPILSHVGLKVNESKSFIDSRFLESCGMDAFEGQDVTPVRLRAINLLDFSSATSQSQLAVSTVEHGNLANQRGYHYLANQAFSLASRYFGKLPRVPVQSGVIGIHSQCPLDWDHTDGRRKLSAWRVKPLQIEFPCNPWDHYRRVITSSGGLGRVSFGKFSLPRDFELERVDIPSHLVAESSYPTWVQDLVCV